jgi:hypothetical protein
MRAPRRARHAVGLLAVLASGCSLIFPYEAAPPPAADAGPAQRR